MGRRAAWLSLWFFFGCAGAKEAQGPTVGSVHLEGTHQVPGSEVKAVLQTQGPSWLPFSQPSEFDREVWQTDLRRLERFYRERGFYQAQVTASEVKPRPDDTVELRVSVEEGPRTVVKEVAVRGLGGLNEAEREKVWSALPLRPGDPMVETRWESFVPALRRALAELGYARAEVEGQAEVDLEQHLAHLRVQAHPGRRYRFGKVYVGRAPNSQVPAWRVEERVERALRRHPFYSESAKEYAQRRVVQMGVFGSVEIRNGPPDEESGEIPLVVDVRESPFHTLRGGGGLGVDQGRLEVRVLGQYSHRNFLGGLRRLTLNARAGYAVITPFSLVARLGPSPRSGPVGLFGAELRQPRVWDPSLDGFLRTELERQIEPTYSYWGARVRVGLVWQWGTHFTVTPAYGFEAYHQDAGTAFPGIGAPILLFGCNVNCVLSYLEQTLEYDRRDDKLSPKHGYYLSVAFQEGGGPLGGSFSYLRYTPEARVYLTPENFPAFTLAGRVRIGSLNPTSGNPDDSPSVARFYSGGANQMRGFGTRRLSPMVVVPLNKPSHGFTGEAEPVGGNGLLEASVEARYQTGGEWAVATFLDTGTVTRDSIDFGRFNDILSRNQIAVGAGVRYRTPAGPLRLDLAYRPNIGPPLQVTQLNPAEPLTYPSPTGCFGIGGRQGTRAGSPESPCSLNLSIGEAF